MDDFYYFLSDEQIQFFQTCGYLHIPRFLNTPETQSLQQWAQEVHDLPRTADASWMPYEVCRSSSKRNLGPADESRKLIPGERESFVGQKTFPTATMALTVSSMASGS